MTYLSTIVSIAALLAVATALFVQQYQARVAQMVGVRERHFELIKLMLEHPELDYNATERTGAARTDAARAGAERAGAERSHPAGEHADDRMTAIGMSLWVAHWNTLWHIDKLDEKALRFNLADLFADPDARLWWRKVGGAWSSKGSRRERRFLEIVADECDSALARPAGRSSGHAEPAKTA